MDDIPTCAKLKIDKPDFSIDFDWQKCIWIASWKWTNSQSSDDLKNKILKYFILKNIREDYDKELQLLLDNGWLILSPEK